MTQLPMNGERQTLRALRHDWGANSLDACIHHSQLLTRLKVWCRHALAAHHLVEVSSALLEEFGFQEAQLASLGLPVDLLALFPHWRHASRDGFQPRVSGMRIRPEGASLPLGHLRLQLSPLGTSITWSLQLVCALLRRLDPAVGLWITAEPGTDLEELARLLATIVPGATQRVRLAHGHVITMFAQDTAKAALNIQGQPVLWLPRAFGIGHRREDALSPQAVQDLYGMAAVQSALFWEGGNLLHDGRFCLVGADTIATNVFRLGLAAGEVKSIMEAEIGCSVVVLGDLAATAFDPDRREITSSGQARFHLDLDVCLTGRYGRKRRPRALISDVAWGLELWPAIAARDALFRDHFVSPAAAREYILGEYEACAERSYPILMGYQQVLRECGYRVVGLPSVGIQPDRNLFGSVNLDFGFCNALPGLWRGRPAIYHLPWSLRALNQAATKQLQQQGLHPVPVGNGRIADALMQRIGGLHCFCGQLR